MLKTEFNIIKWHSSICTPSFSRINAQAHWHCWITCHVLIEYWATTRVLSCQGNSFTWCVVCQPQIIHTGRHASLCIALYICILATYLSMAPNEIHYGYRFHSHFYHPYKEHSFKKCFSRIGSTLSSDVCQIFKKIFSLLSNISQTLSKCNALIRSLRYCRNGGPAPD